MMKTEVKDLVYYLSLPYTTILRRDEEGDVIARIEELPGCISHGGDEAEALSNLASMKQLWLKTLWTSSQLHSISINWLFGLIDRPLAYQYKPPSRTIFRLRRRYRLKQKCLLLRLIILPRSKSGCLQSGR